MKSYLALLREASVGWDLSGSLRGLAHGAEMF